MIHLPPVAEFSRLPQVGRTALSSANGGNIVYLAICGGKVLPATGGGIS